MSSTFLNVTKSLSGKRWVIPAHKEDLVNRMMQTQGLPEILSRLLINRDVSAEQAQDFLAPSLKSLPDPHCLKDMEKLSVYLADAIEQKKAIGIFADFDVDGATSSAILKRFFKGLGLDVPVVIPDRLHEGYGPNIAAFKRIKEDGADILIIADCGIAAHDVIDAGRKMGLEIIILDHHEPITCRPLPEAHFIIDPKRDDDSSGLDYLCAAGVCWMTCYALGRELLKRGKVANKQELKLGALLDLVALGTVCDMVPLTGINRAFVKAGLDMMQRREKPGIAALASVSQIPADKAITSFHLGFGFGPRINAGSRMKDSSLGSRLLSTDNEREALEIAQILDELNEQRKTLSASLQKQALQSQDKMSNYDPRITVSVLPEAKGDVKGLVASELCSRFSRPALALMPKIDPDSGEVLLSGSARSVGEFDLAAMMFAATDAGVMVKGGGHAMAAGCLIREDKLPAFMEWLPTYLDATNTPHEFIRELELDGLISVDGASVSAIHRLDQVGPYGQGNREPKFVLADVQIYDAKTIGADKSHISCRISEKEGGKSMKAIAFRAANTPLGDAILMSARDHKSLHLAGKLDVNEWQGRESAQLIIEDGALI